MPQTSNICLGVGVAYPHVAGSLAQCPDCADAPPPAQSVAWKIEGDRVVLPFVNGTFLATILPIGASFLVHVNGVFVGDLPTLEDAKERATSFTRKFVQDLGYELGLLRMTEGKKADFER